MRVTKTSGMIAEMNHEGPTCRRCRVLPARVGRLYDGLWSCSMIKDPKKFQEWEDCYSASTPVNPEQNRAIAESLMELARAAGTFPPANLMEGIEVKIALARIINCSANSYKPLPKR